MIEGAETDRQKCDRIAMGGMRSYMVPELKNYVDLAKLNSKTEFWYNGSDPNPSRGQCTEPWEGTVRGTWSEGKIAVVDFTVGSVVLKSIALALPGEDIA